MSVCLSVRWQKMALLVLRRVGLCIGQNQMCHLCGGENKKYRRVGNECRLTRCPFAIWSVCCSPVKMVCLCSNFQFLVVCSMVALLSFRLAYNGCVYEALGIAGFVPIRRHKRRCGAERLI